MRFWDTSALIPLCQPEQSSRTVRSLYDRDGDAVVWWGSRVECLAQLARVVRESRLDAMGEAQVRDRIEVIFDAVVEIEPTDDVRDRAERLLAVHSLRAADALQLAAALIWARERPARLGFVCLDDQLRRAAGREGFDLLPSDRLLAR
jgi:predicted nucleic acid-binding protein